jgi:hypothetical protein
VKVGDLVALRLCQDAGKIGMITDAPASAAFPDNPEFALYWVLIDRGNQCFTGSQLIRHKWMENESR